MTTIFTRIVQGEIPCYKIAETNECLAFLDINPLAKGHTLVIPKREVDYFLDLEDPLYQNLFLFAKKIGKAIGKTIPCSRVGMTVIGLEVPHAHIHLIPIKSIYDMEFSRPKLSMSPEEFENTASIIRQAIC